MTTDDSLRRLSDELEIRNLLAELTLLADTAPEEGLDRYLSLFTEDASWAVVTGGEALTAQERRGQKEILEGVLERRSSGAQGPGTNTRHALHTTLVSFEGADAARAVSYWHYYTNTDSVPVLAALGEYRNWLVRTSEGWKLARRELLFG